LLQAAADWGECVQHLRAAANMNRDKMTREVVIKNLRLMRAGTELLKFGARGQPKFRQFQLTNDNQGNRYVAWSSENKRPDQTRSKFTDEHVVGCVGIASPIALRRAHMHLLKHTMAEPFFSFTGCALLHDDSSGCRYPRSAIWSAHREIPKEQPQRSRESIVLRPLRYDLAVM